MLSSDTKKECPEKAATFGHSEISQLHYKKRKEISQMIEATRIKTNDKDGCQVEASGSIGDLMMEYKAITEALFKTVSREAGLGLEEELFMKAIRMTIEGEKNERSV
jgi:hypothetical protein